VLVGRSLPLGVEPARQRRHTAHRAAIAGRAVWGHPEARPGQTWTPWCRVTGHPSSTQRTDLVPDEVKNAVQLCHRGVPVSLRFIPVVSGLSATIGQGQGQVLVAPTSADQGTFAVEVTVNVHGAGPEVTFAVARAVDLIRMGSAPWRRAGCRWAT
jgi:hypothetical protein